MAYQWFESGPVRDVTIRNNIFDRPASPVIWFDPITFEGADEVTISRNGYENGLNRRINTRDMDPAEVTVVGDDLALDADRQTSDPVEITYSSSDEEVATVGADGVVTAVGSGTAEIRAHVVVAGREADSAPIRVMVAGKSHSG